MKKYLVVSMLKPTVLYLFILIFLFLSGCAGMMPPIPDERKIPLAQEDTIKGDFEYGSLVLTYSYFLTGSSIILNGKIDYRDSFDSLDVRVLFLDSAGTVLQRKFIYTSGYRTGTSRVSDYTFQETFVVPVGSIAMTFNSSMQERSGHR